MDHLLNVDAIVQKVFLSLLLALASMVVHYIRSMANNIAKLNEKMASIVERVSFHDDIIKEHASRLIDLERTQRLS